MTRRRLAARVEFWRAALAPGWRITLKASGPDWKDEEDYLATQQCDEDYQHAKMYFSDALLERENGEVDVTIVHEVLHMLFRPLRALQDRVKPSLTEGEWAIVDPMFEHAEEELVELLARVVARTEHPDGLVFGTVDQGPFS